MKIKNKQKKKKIADFQDEPEAEPRPKQPEEEGEEGGGGEDGEEEAEEDAEEGGERMFNLQKIFRNLDCREKHRVTIIIRIKYYLSGGGRGRCEAS